MGAAIDTVTGFKFPHVFYRHYGWWGNPKFLEAQWKKLSENSYYIEKIGNLYSDGDVGH